jgi:hypothetical protein
MSFFPPSSPKPVSVLPPSRPKRVRLALEVLDQRNLLSSNPIVTENLLPGNPASEWDIVGAGDSSIQGFATQISVDQGQTVFFKVDTPATDYRLDIYRMGYYGGFGARKVATLQPSATLPQIQPDPLLDDTGLVDAGNWSVSASWAVPVNATSGIYFAKLVREDGPQGASHIFFVVRDDDGHSDMLFQTSDTTWQAYNTWGGGGLYNYEVGEPLRTPKVSYNRPITVRNSSGGMGETNFVFWAEYPMVRFLEANGYSVSYFTNVDTARLGAEILEHKAFLSVGHDEYWSREMRDNVTAARDAGVNLAFFSGNEMYWKTRWETSIDGSGTPHRTLVCYKESRDNAKTDPLPNVWTGLWRDQRFLPQEHEPEQTLIGQIFSVNRGALFPGTSMQVPEEDGKLRFWRNTSVATLQPGEVAFVGDKVLGYEWDEDVDNGFRPAGIIRMSSTTENVPEKLVDPVSWPGCGGISGAPCSTCRGCMVAPGTATHSLTIYRAPSGALVFGAGTVQWSWGLDGTHDGGATNPSPIMRQATVNLFADMGMQPGSLQAGLIPATASTDTVPPNSTITSPPAGIIVQSGSTPITITGTAVDIGGRIGGVEISTDGGLIWRRAEGRTTWSYVWTPQGSGQVTLLSRAADDSARLETPGPGVTVTVLPDNTTPPQLSAISALGVSNQSAVVTWHTDEAATSRVRYGTSSGNLSGDSQSSTPVQSHSRTLTNLAPNTTYYYQVSSTDEFGNTSTSSIFSFTTPAFLDTTAAEFAVGTLVGIVIAETGNGELSLAPAVRAEFSGTNLPAGWSSTAWGAGGGTAVANGLAQVNGARVYTDAMFGPGRSLEFTATFAAVPFQSAGLGNDLNDAPWAMFTTGGAGNSLMVRTRASGSPSSTETALPGSWLNSPHRFRIDWSSTGITYFIDDAPVASHAVAVTTPMRPVVSDFTVDGQALGVDWVRLSPYQASGSYTSRVFDAGSAVRWIPTWNPNLPGGTGVNVSVRMGDTATPGAQWTDYIPVAPGQTMGGKSRYLQYRVVLTSSNPAVSPTLPEVSLSYTTAPDTVAPSIVSRTPAATATLVDPFTSVVISFSELLNPSTINASTVRLRAVNGTQDIPASVGYAGSTITLTPLAGLAGNREYRVTVAGSVSDTSGNLMGSDQTWTFTTGPRQVSDTSSSDFALGSLSGTYLTNSGNGEVVLAPTVASEFSGSSTPTGWSTGAWGSNGTAVVSGGAIALNGTRVWTDATYSAGRSLEFVATFTGAPFQHIGFTQDFNNQPWVMFSTDLGGALYARTNGTATQLPGTWLNQPHLFRIDWSAAGASYSIDGAQVASHAVSVGGALRPAASDYTDSGDSLVVDWMQMTPFQPEGTYQSRVFDAGQLVGWNVATWNRVAPVGTSIAIGVRMGNSAVPDASWTDFIPVATSGTIIGGSSRYLQYQATLATTVVTRTPTLQDINFVYAIPSGPGEPPSSIDNVTPAIISRSPATSAIEIDPGAAVVVKFGELLNAATVNSTSFRLREQGASADVPAVVSFSGSTATLTPMAPLTGNRTYQVTVAGSVADLAGNALGTASTWTFTTRVPSVKDTTLLDFAAGANAGTYLSQTGDGGVMLAPSLAAEFDGSSLPSGWSSTPWNAGGGSSIGGGVVAVDGAILQHAALVSAGRSLEFVGSFSGAAFQHIGFADFANPAWIMFSTSTGGALYARTNYGSPTDTLLPGDLLSSTHRFRIDWAPSSVTYFVDDVQVASHSIAVNRTLPVMASDYVPGDGGLTLDWVRLGPYQATGSFHSRFFDAGQAVSWLGMTWSAATPTGTSLSMSVRMGNTPTPDASWTDFISVHSSASIGGRSRYLQYRADLTTSMGGTTPELQQVTVNYHTDPDSIAPRVVSQVPGASATGIDPYSSVVVKFGELMNSATIHTGTFRLRAQGSSSDVLANITYSGSTATLTPTAPLSGNSVYTVTLSPDIADLAGNTLGSGLNLLSWSFTTGVATFGQTTATQFETGTLAGTAVTSVSGGEIQLLPTFTDPFGGASLNSGKWTVQAFTTPDITVANGQVAVSGAALWSTQAYAGTPAEGRIQFGASPYQYFGLATSLDAVAGNYWAAFSTGGTTGTLFARVNVSGSTSDVDLGPLPAGYHDYRIQPGTGGFEFYIDGALRTTLATSFPLGVTPKVVLSSYLGSSSPALQADSVGFVRFEPSGTYTSAIFDALNTANWSRVDWNAILPSGTTLAVEARTTNALVAGNERLIVGGSQQVFDGYGSNSWSTWTPLTNGADLTSVLTDSRYVQYRMLLSSSDGLSTAAVTDLVFSWL